MSAARRIVDLSHVLHPGREGYGLEIESRFVDEVYPQSKRRPDVWYILQSIRMSSQRIVSSLRIQMWVSKRPETRV